MHLPWNVGNVTDQPGQPRKEEQEWSATQGGPTGCARSACAFPVTLTVQVRFDATWRSFHNRSKEQSGSDWFSDIRLLSLDRRLVFRRTALKGAYCKSLGREVHTMAGNSESVEKERRRGQ